MPYTRGFEVAVETNGTIAAPVGIDWLCVSPKAGATLVQESGNELKLVYAQPGFGPDLFEGFAFRNWFLQPMDVPEPAKRTSNIELAIRYSMQHPQWRLSVQTHKIVGIR